MCACSLSDFKRGGLTSNLQHNLDASVNGSNGFAEEKMIVGVLLGCFFSLNNHTQLLRCMTDRYECLMRKPQLVELLVPYLATKTSAAQQALLKHRSPETQVKSQQPRTAVSWEMIWAYYFITLLCSQKSLFHNIHWNAHLLIPLVQQIGSTHVSPSPFVCTCVRLLNSELKQEKGSECRTTKVYLKKHLKTSGRSSSRPSTRGRREAELVTLQSSL